MRAPIKGLSNVGDVITPVVSDNVKHAFHLFVIRTKKRDDLKKFLMERKIETGIHYPISLPKLEAYSYLQGSDIDFIANQIDCELLSLPISDQLSVKNAEDVVEAIKLFFKKN